MSRVLTLAEIDAELRRREQETIDAEIARRSFADFFRMFWPTIEPDPLLWNWHLDAIGDHLGAVARREIRTLLIEMPPRMLKSRMVSVAFPAWVWATNPAYRAIFGSYSASLAGADSVYCRKIVESPLYQRCYAQPQGWELLHDRNTVAEFINTRGGHRIATSVEGTGTGKGGDLVVADDPLNSKEAYSEAARVAASAWWLKTMVSRLNDRRTGCRVMVMQRLHPKDPAGEWLARGSVQVRLNLAMRYNARRTFSFGRGYTDPRATDGELLDPVRFPQAEVDTMAKDLGPDASAQLDQDPQGEGGNFFKLAWMRFYRLDGEKYDAVRPEGCPSQAESPTRVISPDYNARRVLWEHVVLSLDANFKGKFDKGHDPISLTAWGVLGADRFMLDRVSLFEGFTETKAAVRAMAAKYPEAWAKLVEAKANGDAIVDDLQGEIPGLILVEPAGGKEARAARCRAYFMSGNVWFPEGAPWLHEVVRQFSEFPKSDHDDDVDSTTQFLNWFATEAGSLMALEVWARKD